MRLAWGGSSLEVRATWNFVLDVACLPMVKVEVNFMSRRGGGMAPIVLLTMAEVAARSGFAPSALRFYERAGLITATRTSGNQRRYGRPVLRSLDYNREASN